MRGRFSRALRPFTIVLLGVTIWTAYANVFSDDTDVRSRARELAQKHAGCGEKCRVTDVRGARGMLEERITYDIDAPFRGEVLVVCRRVYVVAGDYACTASKP